MLHIIHTKTELWHYLLSETYERQDVNVFEVDTFHTYLRILKRLLPTSFTKYPILFLRPKDIKKIQQIQQGDSLLVLGHTSPLILSAINNILPEGITKFIYLWNPLLSMVGTDFAAQQLINKYTYLGFKSYTFNSYDMKFGLQLTNQVYRLPDVLNEIENESEYDFYFLGYEKDRDIDILQLQIELEKRGYKTLIDVKKPGGKPITYKENIENLKKSRIIIDLVQKGQTGQTLRPLEAIAFQKKLLTNNKSIINESFYSPENIFVIEDVVLPSSFDKFVNNPYKEIRRQDYHKYDINNWIDGFNY